MDELQAGMEQPLAVLRQPPVLAQPGKAALNDPALGHDLEAVQLAPLRSVNSAVVTATACGKPCVFIAMWRLMPDTFLPAS